MIRLYLILLKAFWFLHISFVQMVKFEFIAHFPVDHFPPLVLPSLILFLRELDSLIMGLIILSLSPHNQYLLFCFVFSAFALTYLILMALFCTAVRRDSVSLLRCPFNFTCFLLEMSIQLFFFPLLF